MTSYCSLLGWDSGFCCFSSLSIFWAVRYIPLCCLSISYSLYLYFQHTDRSSSSIVFIAIFVADVAVAFPFSYFTRSLWNYSGSRLYLFILICRCPFCFWLLFSLLFLEHIRSDFFPYILFFVYIHASYFICCCCCCSHCCLLFFVCLTCFKYFPFSDILFFISGV